jgi:hypothetical protein
MGMITSSDAVLNDTVSLASSAPIRGTALQIVLDPRSSLPSLPHDQPPQEPAIPYDRIALVSTGAVKETRLLINPATMVSPLPTPPLTPEIPAKSSPTGPSHFASLGDAQLSQTLSTLNADELEIRYTCLPHGNARSSPFHAQ